MCENINILLLWDLNVCYGCNENKMFNVKRHIVEYFIFIFLILRKDMAGNQYCIKQT